MRIDECKAVAPKWYLYVAICYTIKWIQKKKTARRVSTSGAAQNEHNGSGVHHDDSIIQWVQLRAKEVMIARKQHNSSIS